MFELFGAVTRMPFLFAEKLKGILLCSKLTECVTDEGIVTREPVPRGLVEPAYA